MTDRPPPQHTYLHQSQRHPQLHLHGTQYTNHSTPIASDRATDQSDQSDQPDIQGRCDGPFAAVVSLFGNLCPVHTPTVTVQSAVSHHRISEQSYNWSTTAFTSPTSLFHKVQNSFAVLFHHYNNCQLPSPPETGDQGAASLFTKGSIPYC